ncbi:DUF6624 domain-containing protein [Streptomyces sp. SR27]|uniref:DUF6624 domain-containing protein n=1 Tax=Streptomyces sp. SR27 TaxID=3076630 RepID=UPI00295B6C1E|nr:DUF6624 domain-containing protein [Streptomyces sp. SR27]MDV9188547.1 DUF6624 domain-containing protein [Streptomyces sp. SR27]
MSTEPQHPHLAAELIVRARRADEHWARLVRMRATDLQIGAGRHDDHVNATVLGRKIADYGWPDVPLVGEDGARAAWRIALRADVQPDMQRLSLRLMYEAVERGAADLSQWAHLYDRCLLGRGLPQHYGTQYVLGPDGPRMQTVAGPAGDLDARRAAVNLPPSALALRCLRARLAEEPRTDDQRDDGAAVDLADAA